MSVQLHRLLEQRRRDLFVPVVFRLAAKLEQMTWDDLAADPASTTFALRSSQRLFGADGLVNWFDTHLEAEAAGLHVVRDEMGQVVGIGEPPGRLPTTADFLAGGSIPVAVDVAARLCAETAGDSAVLGYLTGPRTMLAPVVGDDQGTDRTVLDAAVQLLVELLKAYCDAGVGGALVAEDVVLDDLSAPALEPLFNVARYYGIPLVLLSRPPVSGAVAADARRAGFDVPADPLPLDLVTHEGAPDGWRARQGRTPAIRLTQWEAPLHSIPENVIALSRAITEQQNGQDLVHD